MSLQDRPIKRPPPTIWPIVSRIQLSLGLSQEQMADICHLTLKEYVSLRHSDKDLPLQNAFFLCDRFNIGIEKLVKGDIDFNALVQQFAGNTAYMPLRYLESANSKRRTVINILNYIESHYGWETRFRYLQRFQMSEVMFLDPNAPINLRYSVDLCNTLLRETRNHEVLLKIGQNAALTNKHSEMGQSLARARNLHELFELMFSEVAEKYIEKNIHWKILGMNKSSCTLEGKPDADIVAALGKENVFSSAGTYVREGFVSSIPAYLDFDFAPVKRISCVSQGDENIRFEVNFDNIISSKRPVFSVIN